MEIEQYILKTIDQTKTKLENLEKEKADYSERDFWALFHRYTGQISILYQVLTAHDNTYNETFKTKK